MSRILSIESLLCVAAVLILLTLTSRYMEPAGSKRTGSGDPCICGGKMMLDADGKAFTCSGCGRREAYVIDE